MEDDETAQMGWHGSAQSGTRPLRNSTIERPLRTSSAEIQLESRRFAKPVKQSAEAWNLSLEDKQREVVGARIGERQTPAPIQHQVELSIAEDVVPPTKKSRKRPRA